MLFGERLRLLLGEAALGQSLDEAMSVEGDGLGHDLMIAISPAEDKNLVGEFSNEKTWAKRRPCSLAPFDFATLRVATLRPNGNGTLRPNGKRR